MALNALQTALVGLEVKRGLANRAHQDFEQIFADSHSEYLSLASPRVRNRCQILPGAVLNDVVPALGDGFSIHQLATHRYRAGAGSEKISGGLQIHTAGGDHFN